MMRSGTATIAGRHWLHIHVHTMTGMIFFIFLGGVRFCFGFAIELRLYPTPLHVPGDHLGRFVHSHPSTAISLLYFILYNALDSRRYCSRSYTASDHLDLLDSQQWPPSITIFFLQASRSIRTAWQLQGRAKHTCMYDWTKVMMDFLGTTETTNTIQYVHHRQ